MLMPLNITGDLIGNAFVQAATTNTFNLQNALKNQNGLNSKNNGGSPSLGQLQSQSTVASEGGFSNQQKASIALGQTAASGLNPFRDLSATSSGNWTVQAKGTVQSSTKKTAEDLAKSLIASYTTPTTPINVSAPASPPFSIDFGDSSVFNGLPFNKSVEATTNSSLGQIAFATQGGINRDYNFTADATETPIGGGQSDYLLVGEVTNNHSGGIQAAGASAVQSNRRKFGSNNMLNNFDLTVGGSFENSALALLGIG